MTTRAEAIRDQIKYKNIWRRDFLCLILLHYTVGILIIGLSSLLAAKPEFFGFSQTFYQLIAWVIAASTAVITFLQPQAMGLRFHQAWVILDAEIKLYLEDPSRHLATVLDAWQQGEAIIQNYQKRSLTRSRQKSRSPN
jgi:hypothetical protein